MPTQTYKIGNCTDLLKSIPNDSIDCVVTSPPYNKGNKADGVNWKHSSITYGLYKDDMPEREYQEWQRSVLKELIRIIKPTGSIFYNHKPRQVNHAVILPTEWMQGFDIKQVIIWDRNSTPNINPNGFYATTEWIVWIRKQIPKFNPQYAIHKEIWKFKPESDSDHPAPFPVELPLRCIQATTNEGDTVLDPFCGSGTTLRACRILNRNGIGFEIDPQYEPMIRQWSMIDMPRIKQIMIAKQV